MTDDFFYGLDVTQDGVTRSVCVGRYPMRKSYALYVMEPGLSRVVTYLRSRKEAESMAKLLEALARGQFNDR